MSAIEKRYRVLFYFTPQHLLLFAIVLLLSLNGTRVFLLILYGFYLIFEFGMILEPEIENFRADLEALPPERRQRLDREFVAAGRPLRNRHWTFLQDGILIWDTRYRKGRDGSALTILRYEDICVLERDRMILRIYLRSSGGANGFYYTYRIDQNGIPPLLTEKTGCPVTVRLLSPNEPPSGQTEDLLTKIAVIVVFAFIILTYVFVLLFIGFAAHS